MTISPLAGKPAPKEMLIDLARLEREYFDCRPDLDDPEQRRRLGAAARELFLKNSGATARTLQALQPLLRRPASLS